MTNSVVTLHGGPAPGEPDPDVLQALDTLRERAERGEVRGLVFVSIDADDGFTYARVGTEPSFLAFAGAASYLQFRTVERSLEGNDS